MKYSAAAIIALAGLAISPIHANVKAAKKEKKSTCEQASCVIAGQIVSPNVVLNTYNADDNSCECVVEPPLCEVAQVAPALISPALVLTNVYDYESHSCSAQVDLAPCPIAPVGVGPPVRTRSLQVAPCYSGPPTRNRRSLYDERELLTLLDEKERGEALKAYAEREVSMGRKPHPYSKEKSQVEQDRAPWASPSSDKAALLASDPGIWMVDDFLTNEESDKLIGMIKKHGYEKSMFGPCSDPKLQAKGHPHFETPNRLCFKMSPKTVHNELFYKKAQIADAESVHQGHLDFEGYDCGESGCSAKTDPEDGAFLASIMTKVKDLWSTNVNPRPHVSVVHVNGTALPLRTHDDSGILVSFVLYLTNGGAATVFTKAGVTIVPRKGALAMWFNMDENGNMNPMAQHAVQAHPGSAGERVTMNIFIRDVTPEEFLVSQVRS